MQTGINDILNLLKEKRGFDFSGHRPSMVEQRIAQRLDSIRCPGLIDYLIGKTTASGS